MPHDDESDAGDICLACGGPLTFLGPLGNVQWMRCRNCGLDQYRNPNDPEQTEVS